MAARLLSQPGRRQASDRLSLRHEPVSSPRSLRRPEPLWYAVCVPALRAETCPRTRLRQLNQLAQVLRSFSDKVSLQAPDALVFEVRSSLRYFGGIENIRSTLVALVSDQLQTWEMPAHFHQSASPTPASSLLLARSGVNLIVFQSANLRSVLGRLPIGVLPLNARQMKQLRQSGLMHLRDLWRLPGAALRQQFGNELPDYLERCLGRQREILHVTESAPSFRESMELEFPVEYVDRLSPLVQELVSRLCSFLQQRELSTGQLLLQLSHEAQPPTEVEIRLRQAGRSEAHLMLLLENRLNGLILAAPVIALALESTWFDAFVAEVPDLLDDRRAAGQGGRLTLSVHQLLEQLQARLGNTAVNSLRAYEELSPEHASRQWSYGSEHPGSNLCCRRPRPCWLLEKPSALLEKHGRLYASEQRSFLDIVSEAERVETRWWEGPDIRRDYFVAMDAQGRRFWIFHARSPDTGWYLHGIF